ncbi:MAG: nucleotide exchange factor GrpE [Chloroflexi bacterium]|nr:nucleotide exchange factor GrpE [Chloroflexota bacterium]
MNLFERIAQRFAPSPPPTPPSRPPTVLVEFLADRGRLEQELSALGSLVAAGETRSREGLAELAERLAAASAAIQSALAGTGNAIKTELAASRSALSSDLATSAAAIREDLAQSQATLAEQIDGVGREVGKLGREQFRATTLLDGHSETLDELAGAWREHLELREREADEARQVLARLEDQIRLGLVKDLLPVADALAESIRAARDLRSELRMPPAPELPRPSPEPPRPSLLDWLRGAPPPPAPPVPPTPAPPRSRTHDAALASWLDGLLLVERRLLALLEREDVRPIATTGEIFDPNRHIAVAVESDGKAPDGTIVSEELRGFTLGDRVLRHAEVVVARGGISE